MDCDYGCVMNHRINDDKQTHTKNTLGVCVRAHKKQKSKNKTIYYRLEYKHLNGFLRGGKGDQRRRAHGNLVQPSD